LPQLSVFSQYLFSSVFLSSATSRCLYCNCREQSAFFAAGSAIYDSPEQLPSLILYRQDYFVIAGPPFRGIFSRDGMIQRAD